MKLNEITGLIGEFAPVIYQESYDNSGLIAGSPELEIKGAVLCLDCTEAVVDETLKLGCNLIISHHPLIFSGLKKITGANFVERTLIKAIKNNIAIYACHTNIDNVANGVNKKICDKLGLANVSILSPKSGILKKLVTFVPPSHHEVLLTALFAAGAGRIGNYDHCSFNLEGSGTFRGNDKSNPFLGKPGELSREKEIRVEAVFEISGEKAVLSALRSSHPYEEPAFDVYALTNQHPGTGSGMLGEFTSPVAEKGFLELVKKTFQTGVIRHTPLLHKAVKKVAVCGGSGRFLLGDAIRRGADAFITADFKYHDFFEVDGKLLLADIGHYESEQFTPEIFYGIINKKFPTFALHLSKINTNPINYF